MRLDFWANLGVVSGALLAFTGVVLMAARLARGAWAFLRREEEARDALLGDKAKGIKSIKEELRELRTDVAGVRAELAEHVRWHGNPGNRPAGGTTPRPDGRGTRGGGRRE
jgi:hypothetical protein